MSTPVSPAQSHDIAPAGPEEAPKSRNLDPADWSDFRRLAHAMLDDMISHIETIEEQRVWQPAPAASRERFTQPLPRDGRSLSRRA